MVECLAPLVEAGAEGIEGQAGIVGWIGLEAALRRGKQRCGADGVSAPEMMKRCGHLDERLEKCFFRLGAGQPNGLPMLMGGKELPRAVTVQAFGQGAAVPIERHGLIMSETVKK